MFTGRGTDITRDTCFQGRGTQVASDMCFSGRGRHTSSYMCKNKKFKKSKNWDFSKGVSPWFVKNWKIFHLFIFDKVGRESVFHDILQREKRFLDYKNKKLKKLKKWDFSNGVSRWFWSKIKSDFV